MLPGRHQLAKQHEVALGTLERAVATLIAEGVLRAEAGRGTFVASAPLLDATSSARTARPPFAASCDRKPLVATVGIIAAIVPYDWSCACCAERTRPPA